MSDLFNRLMDISDLVIVSHSKEKKKPTEYVPQDMAGIFKKFLPLTIKKKLLRVTLILSQFDIYLCDDEQTHSNFFFLILSYF